MKSVCCHGDKRSEADQRRSASVAMDTKVYDIADADIKADQRRAASY